MAILDFDIVVSNVITVIALCVFAFIVYNMIREKNPKLKSIKELWDDNK